MRKQLLRIVVFCAASVVCGLQAQSSSDTSGSSGSSSSPGSSSSSTSGSPGSQSGWTGGRLGAGHMGHQELRVSQLTGAQVTGTSGSELGTISDVIINPSSGRIDFAILSMSQGASSSTGSATSPGGTSSTSPSSSSSLGTSSSSTGGASSPGASTSGSSSTVGGKQVAVPWALLRMGSSSSSAASTSGTSGQQPSFSFNGDDSKLQSAPTFDATTDLSQPGWRHSVFSYFGLSGSGAATGSAETPGSSSSGSSSGSSSDSSGSSIPTPPSGSTPHR